MYSHVEELQEISNIKLFDTFVLHLTFRLYGKKKKNKYRVSAMPCGSLELTSQKSKLIVAAPPSLLASGHSRTWSERGSVSSICLCLRCTWFVYMYILYTLWWPTRTERARLYAEEGGEWGIHIYICIREKDTKDRMKKWMWYIERLRSLVERLIWFLSKFDASFSLFLSLHSCYFKR